MPGDGAGEPQQRWACVEHFYQAHKFAGATDPSAVQLMQVLGVSTVLDQGSWARAAFHCKGFLCLPCRSRLSA